MVMVVASPASGELGSLFAAFDKDADGRISAAELRLCMRAALGEDVTAEDAEALVASVDADGDGLLDEGEFARLMRAEAAGGRAAARRRSGGGAGGSWRRSACTRWRARGASRPPA